MITGVTRHALRRLFDEYEWEPTMGELLGGHNPRRGLDWWGDLDEVSFLDRLYDLDGLPSTDDRFDDARGDVVQHRLNNHDRPDSWILDDERFTSSDQAVFEFLAETMHPEVRSAKDDIERLRGSYNQLLRRDGLEIHQASTISGRPVFAGGAAAVRLWHQPPFENPLAKPSATR